MNHFLRRTSLLLLCSIMLSVQAISQTKQETKIGLSTVCGNELADSDVEPAIINFNASTQNLELLTDVFEVLDNKNIATEMEFSEEVNGMPMRMTTQFQVPDLDFKTSADNGQTFTFASIVSCNGKDVQMNVPFTFFYAPQVGQRDNSPTTSFRFDFALSLDPTLFNLDLANGCNEIVIKVQDAILNKTIK